MMKKASEIYDIAVKELRLLILKVYYGAQRPI